MRFRCEHAEETCPNTKPWTVAKADPPAGQTGTFVRAEDAACPECGEAGVAQAAKETVMVLPAEEPGDV